MPCRRDALSLKLSDFGLRPQAIAFDCDRLWLWRLLMPFAYINQPSRGGDAEIADTGAASKSPWGRRRRQWGKLEARYIDRIVQVQEMV